MSGEKVSVQFAPRHDPVELLAGFVGAGEGGTPSTGFRKSSWRVRHQILSAF